MKPKQQPISGLKEKIEKIINSQLTPNEVHKLGWGDFYDWQTDKILALLAQQRQEILKKLPKKRKHSCMGEGKPICECYAGDYNQCLEEVIKIIKAL